MPYAVYFIAIIHFFADAAGYGVQQLLSWFDGDVDHIDDGSPSTKGVRGRYVGGWVSRGRLPAGDVDLATTEDKEEGDIGRPNGFGKMTWDNGISYEGCWKSESKVYPLGYITKFSHSLNDQFLHALSCTHAHTHPHTTPTLTHTS